ncbi:MAG: bifunctional adenosylcobinamide kinase/adenosylcobinamide-phosphate guanylyltransferase [Elusimicrobia bacterium]|nr:bifunctional adenosylcobinamide kinase/adenosylcobinamide-phosphate guanylyltransferase [Candidatus Liberimonas magnetica]
MKTKKIILLTGSVRSGKSGFALKLADKIGGKIAFLATCAPKDKEMKERIKLHKKSRPKTWQTVEAYKDLAAAIKKTKLKADVIIIDCMTLYVSNLMALNKNAKTIINDVSKIMETIIKNNLSAIIVTNEVGWGIVPANKLARNFRDMAGKVNQLMAKQSDEVYIMISGIPLKLK